MESSITDFIVTRLLIGLPLYSVYIVGLFLALKYWRKHPKVSIFTFVACGLMLIRSIASNSISYWLPGYLKASGYGLSQIGFFFKMNYIASNIIYAIAFALLIPALLIDRVSDSDTYS